MFEKLRSLCQSKRDRLRYLPLEEIAPNPRQPRKTFDREELFALTESVRLHGVLQPIAVRLREAPPSMEINNVSVSAPKYEIIAGERRFCAAKKAGLYTIPCVVLDADEKQSAMLALVENMQRSDLNLFEEAEALQTLISVSGMSQSELAAALSMSQASVCNKLRLLRLNTEERRIICSGGLGERHARAFLRVENSEQRMKLILRAVEKSMSAGETERMVEAYLHGDSSSQPPKKQRKIGIIRDIRFFYNTIDRAIETLRDSGIPSECSKNEHDGMTELIIRIPSDKLPGLRIKTE